MGSYEFLLLDINERAEVIWKRGQFIDRFVGVDTSANLYSLGDFFVEVTICNTKNEIISITPFKKGERLTKYLNQIKIENLL